MIKTDRRRTASIVVKDSAVFVTVPRTISNKKGHEIVAKKRRWIKDKLNYYEQTRNPSKTKEYASGEAFAHLGRNYRLTGKLGGVEFKSGKLVVRIPKEYSQSKRESTIKGLLQQWYQESIDQVAPKVGVEPKSMAIKSYESRSGSCNSRQELFFNWKIIIAPN